MCTGLACMYVCALHWFVKSPWRSGDGIGSLGIGVTENSGPPHGYWKVNLGCLQEQQIPFIAQPSPKPLWPLLYISLFIHCLEVCFLAVFLSSPMAPCCWELSLGPSAGWLMIPPCSSIPSPAGVPSTVLVGK